MWRMPLLSTLGLLLWPLACQAVPAFSGAEGWGAVTPGGRGGQVIHVTNLNDSGPGSFREAVTASGPRTVVFDVAGRIDLASKISIKNPYLTIAGQTAPGEGISISGDTLSLDASDITIRHMRFRRGRTDNDHESALTHDGTTGNIVVDHVSASWGLDETLSLYRNKVNPPLIPGGSTILPARNITVQWSIVSEALNPFNHAFGSTLGGVGVNQHHNLWASNTGRNPSISFSHLMDFRNNVIFNWMHRSMDGAGEEAHVNVINNYYKPGPATGYTNNAAHEPIPELKFRIVKPEIRHFVGPGGVGYWYVDGNFVEGYPTISADNWEGTVLVDGVPYNGVQFDVPFDHEWARSDVPFTIIPPFDDPDDPNDDVNGVPIPIPPLPTVATQSAPEAYDSVLAGAGASLVRDAVDQRVVDTVMTGTATAGPRGDGIITDIAQVGGHPVIPFVQRAANFDTDQDGMSNAWELEHGLDDNNAADRNGDFDTDGFTNLEEYLGDLGAFRAVNDIVWDGGNGRYAQIENWNIAFQPSRFDTAVIDNATVTVDAVGQHAGTLKVGRSVVAGYTELHIAGGWLRVANELQIGSVNPVSVHLRLTGGELFTPLLSKTDTATFDCTGGELHADVIDFGFANQGSTIAPGDGIGTTSILGNLALDSGTLEIEIGGTDWSQYDRLEVHGTTTLGGTFAVKLVDLDEGVYVPKLGDTFGFLSAFGGAGGMFDAFDLPELGEGLAWAINPGHVTVFLTVVSVPLAGDYNGNGVVDAADYTVWRDGLASGGRLLNEAASPGIIDAQDYQVWKARFGSSLGGGQVAQLSVPEPAAALQLLIAGLLFPGGSRLADRRNWKLVLAN